MSSTGTTISRSSSFVLPASTILHSRFGPTRNFAIRSSGRCVAESPIRWTGELGEGSRSLPAVTPRSSPDPDRVELSSDSARCEPRFDLRDGVNLVDDHGLDPGEDLADARGKHQIERLGGRDQDVGGRFAHRPPLGLGRVAGAQPDREVGADPRQRRPQVALDVVGERLQRRDVDDPDPDLALGRPRELVDPPEEGRQRLPRAGRGADQGVVALGDRAPAPRLGRRGAGEGGLEPAPDGGAERCHRVCFRTRFCLSGQSFDVTPLPGAGA